MKPIKYFAAAAMALLAMGCSKEQATEVADGQQVQVSFTAELPGGIATKAIGDGLTAKALTVAVYENNADKTELGTLRQTKTLENLKTTVNFSLVKGKTYNFVFWAQAEEGAPYDIADLKNVKVSYDGAAANDEVRDAFYATRKELKVNGALTETVKLYRPFAQVNFGTADYADAVAAGLKPTKSVFTATDVASSFDTFAEEGLDAQDVTFTEAALPGETLKAAEGEYTWMTMNYIIPAGKQGEAHISNLTAEFLTDAGESVKVSAPQAPVRNNYRTNVLGNLLTSQVIFNVEVVPAFEEPDYDIDIVNIKNAESLKALFATGGVATLSENLVLDEMVSVEPGKEVTLELNGKTVSNDADFWDETAGVWSLVSVNGGKLTITGDGVFQAKENDCFPIDVQNGGELIIEGGTFIGNIDAVYCYEGKVEIRGGKFSIQQLNNTSVGPYEYVLNCYDQNRKAGTASIVVYGGEFVNFDPSDCYAEGPHTNFLADGYKTIKTDDVYTVVRGEKPVAMTAAELKAYLTTLTAAGSGDNVVEIAKDIVLKDGETWTSPSVDGYHGAGVITILGNGHTITGLNAPLFAGGFAGKSGIVVKDLTLDGVKISDDTNTQGVGAFVGSADSMPKIELENCHLTNSEIVSTAGARVGGLIGWTAGYNKEGDGPVDMYVTVKNCSVENTNITANGSVGGIIGHAGANAATYQTIESCTVKDCVLNSTDAGGWRVGVVVGTANVGDLTINNTTESGNTVSQTGKTAPAGQSNLYGRFVPGTTGKLTIDGVSIN